MSREQANEDYERIERRMHSRDKIFRQANERVRNAEREIHRGLEAGEISHEEAREAVRELHEEMNYSSGASIWHSSLKIMSEGSGGLWRRERSEKARHGKK